MALYPKAADTPDPPENLPQMPPEQRLALLAQLPDARNKTAIIKRRVAAMIFFADSDGKVYATDEQIDDAVHFLERIYSL